MGVVVAGATLAVAMAARTFALRVRNRLVFEAARRIPKTSEGAVTDPRASAVFS